MEAKRTQLNIRVSEKELAGIKKAAIENGEAVSQYIRNSVVRSKNCSCGEKGYEGIFDSITWTCQACGKNNKWRKS